MSRGQQNNTFVNICRSAQDSGVAVAQIGVGGAAVDADAGDAGLGQGLQLGGLADAVLVQVAPDFELGVDGVGSTDAAIAVGVVLGQGGKAVAGGLAAG